MNAHVPLLTTTSGWSGPREKRATDMFAPPSRKIDPSNPNVGYTTTDAILFALESMGGEGTCREVMQFIAKYKVPIPYHAPKKHPKHGEPKAFDRDKHERGLFTAYYGHCYLNPGWSFIDEVGLRVPPNGKGKAQLVHRINANGRQFLKDRLNGVIPQHYADDLFAIAEVVTRRQKKPRRDLSVVSEVDHRRKLNAMFDAAFEKEPVPHHEYFDARHPMPFVKIVGTSRVLPSDPVHPYHDVFETRRLEALTRGRRLSVQADYDASSEKDSIIVRLDEIFVQQTDESPLDIPPDSESVVEMIQTPRGRQIEMPGFYPPADARGHRAIGTEMRRITAPVFEAREVELRSYLDMAWRRAIAFTSDRFSSDVNLRRNVPVPVPMSIPYDLKNPDNPYHYAAAALFKHAEQFGMVADIEQTNSGFSIRFIHSPTP